MYALMLGDTHGNYEAIQYAVDVCNSQSITCIFQLGDFGYWPRFNTGEIFLEATQALLKVNGITMYFIDGNHEDHTALRAVSVNDNGVAEIGSNLFYLTRGSVHEFGKSKVAAFGGAYSIDRAWRTEGINWFETETCVPEELDRFNGKTADVLLSHDAPSSVDLQLQWALQGRGIYRQYKDAELQRQYIEQAVNTLGVKQVFHGHHHMRYTTNPYDGLTVTGLDCDGGGKASWTIVEL